MHQTEHERIIELLEENNWLLKQIHRNTWPNKMFPPSTPPKRESTRREEE